MIGHPEADDGLAPLGDVGSALLVAELAIEVVVSELRIASGRLVSRFDLLVRRVGLVGLARGQQLGNNVEMQVATLGLAIRCVRPTDLRAFVPIEPPTSGGVEDGLVGLFTVALRIGVFDTEHECAAVVSCECPVEQGGAHQTHVRGGSGG